MEGICKCSESSVGYAVLAAMLAAIAKSLEPFSPEDLKETETEWQRKTACPS